MVSKPHPFDLQQPAFQRQAAAESADGAVAGDNAMARDDDRNGVCATGRSDRARGFGLADFLRHPAVGTRFAARDRLQGPPDGLLESCACREVKGNAPADGFAVGVSPESAGEFADEQRWWRGSFRRSQTVATSGREFDTGDAARGILDTKRAEFRRDNQRITNQMIHSATKDSPSHIKKRLRSCRWARLSGL